MSQRLYAYKGGEKNRYILILIFPPCVKDNNSMEI